MKMKNRLVHISVAYGDFSHPVTYFQKFLTMIPAEEILEAYVRANTSLPNDKGNVDSWNLHLYTKDTRISFYDAVAGYDGDSPRGKTFKILSLAGFNVSVEDIISCTEDLHFKK